MVKKRTYKKETTQMPSPTNEAIERFASAADGNTSIKIEMPKPNAPRNYKAISVPFNEFEYGKLEELCLKTGRSKLNAIRWSILKLSELENN
ncbi:MAG: hypothetical protein Q9M18_04890 [Mariprofundaceae bacterium]|nr:hypothetical protein [Mariprofundaceae bacterium]